MIFSSNVFLFLFLPIVLVGYYNPFIKSRTYRNVFLLVMSLFFYAWGEPKFTFILLVSILITWILGKIIYNAEKHKKRVLSIGIMYHIAVILIFKYMGFFSREVNKYTSLNLREWNILLPIGISFFTFQMMSYLFDVYYGKCEPQKNVLNLGLYVALFPQLIAGPIVRYETVEKEILYRAENIDDFLDGCKRFIYGLSKKVLIADYMAIVADMVFENKMGTAVLTMWLGAIAYTFQIYFDFSGYSDMAIGLGRMFGFHFEENFNYPYIASSVTDFWRRWHISLGGWFKDYVYIPLGGNRCSIPRNVLNIFVIWLLTGIWHGANWTYIIWGLTYFVIITFEKVVKRGKTIKGVDNLLTFLTINLCFVTFRSQSMNDAIHYYKIMFSFGNVLYDNNSLWIMMGALGIFVWAVVFSLPIYPVVKKKVFLKYRMMEVVIVCCLAILSLCKTTSAAYSPFIYFNF